MRGWVYVLSNKAMPELVKIGFTMKDPTLRARELEQTGVPHPFFVEYEALVINPREIEQSTHNSLEYCRERKEFFKCSQIHAVDTLRKHFKTAALIENIYFNAPENTEPRTSAHEHKKPTEKHAQQKENITPRVSQIKFCATYKGACQFCLESFSVTVTRHDYGAACPKCFRFNQLTDFRNKEFQYTNTK